ncbi:MAG TPA: hypothetical protein VF812_12470 [Ktedonobacterales bacterium]
MGAEHPRVRRSHPRRTSSGWLTLGLSILVLGVSIFALGRYGGLYVRPSIHYQLQCADSSQCLLTIQHAGGGFDHGFNPAYSWAITGDPVASLHFSPPSGTLQAYHSVQVRVVVAPGSCPTAITITSKMDILHFSPFLTNTRTGQCTVIAPVLSS